MHSIDTASGILESMEPTKQMTATEGRCVRPGGAA